LYQCVAPLYDILEIFWTINYVCDINSENSKKKYGKTKRKRRDRMEPDRNKIKKGARFWISMQELGEK
jgi:hypothetical protein